MKRALIVFLFCGMGATSLLSQNIFDDDALETPKPTPETKPAAKPAAKASKKKKKAKKKKKSAAKDSASPAGNSYAPEDVARASYAWAPETEPLALATTAPGIKAPVVKEQLKPQAMAMKPETVEEKPAANQGGGFKLPQIPLAQVLIVAGFVILFLIYRFRVGRQIKRKRY